MKISETRIPAVKIIEPQVFEDDRGYFFEAYRKSELKKAGIDVDFVQDNVSKSYKNTVRGLHYQIQNPQDKLVQCLKGSILDVAVDLRQDSPSFGNYVAFKLSDVSKRMLFIPKGFAHGFSVLSDEAIVAYKCSDYYNAEGERGVRWDDPLIRVHWDVSRPILSEKDRTLPLFSSLKEEDLF
ncbi:dTDP-4-dehydrorhamnose 3,5-epimerase [Gracilimonas sediminicola]|uniref:dTDP-4-dehydrorhamnose 3,5-epimerase n=1 Tax=Gracilimonas sediminicola TaxID=2952158 RepID=A0A9X2L0L5_9BACT|nr:dTDP-4-dehydrorhamnose 3,5-epimerase [Gracilimonas sediminicola]MCP9290074.1 dTDP-4-dehydrorhamnose 3,5-epimerase [Gracilimonas sediminicola]